MWRVRAAVTVTSGRMLVFAPPSSKRPVAEAKLKARRGAESRAERGTKIANITRVQLKYRTRSATNSVHQNRNLVP
ncbi:hypothetical protein EVAR_56815_1 [Eumeta japonica]|uniref:Uncharacterized protein n=1 Tax=Eumeta variegata TaxID=151549 RepID=A0A4C1XZ26_EUMVA|nr:hypothetical protein EVAR_56815_1 [Eumeta japonica]